jgi:hypothetical protein
MLPVKTQGNKYDATSNKVQKSRLTMEYSIIEKHQKAEIRQLEIEKKAFQREVKNEMKRIINRFNSRVARHTNLVHSIDYKDLMSKTNHFMLRPRSIAFPDENKSDTSFECSTYRAKTFLTEPPHIDNGDFARQLFKIQKTTKDDFESSFVEKSEILQNLPRISDPNKLPKHKVSWQKQNYNDITQHSAFDNNLTDSSAANSLTSLHSFQKKRIIQHKDIDSFFEQFNAGSTNEPNNNSRLTYTGYDSYINLNKFNTAFNTPSTLVTRYDSKEDKNSLNNQFQNPFESLDCSKNATVKKQRSDENLITSAVLKERLVKAKPFFPYALKESIQDKKMFERISNVQKIRNLTIKSVQF